MRRLHKGLLIGGVTLAALVPAGLVAADQFGNGNGKGPGNGNGNGPGNGTMTQDCTQDQQRDQEQIQARDGTGPRHEDITNGTATGGNGHRSGPMDGSGPQADRPLDGTGNQWGGKG